jgi:hypothetical protein
MKWAIKKHAYPLSESKLYSCGCGWIGRESRAWNWGTLKPGACLNYVQSSWSLHGKRGRAEPKKVGHYTSALKLTETNHGIQYSQWPLWRVFSVIESLVCGDSDKLMHTMWSFRTGLASISVDGHLASAYAWMKYISRWPLGECLCLNEVYQSMATWQCLCLNDAEPGFFTRQVCWCW